jgi:hypothetical protein
VNPGEGHKQGPNLGGLFGRKTGQAAGFRCASRQLQLLWQSRAIVCCFLNPVCDAAPFLLVCLCYRVLALLPLPLSYPCCAPPPLAPVTFAVLQLQQGECGEGHHVGRGHAV